MGYFQNTDYDDAATRAGQDAAAEYRRGGGGMVGGALGARSLIGSGVGLAVDRIGGALQSTGNAVNAGRALFTGDVPAPPTIAVSPAGDRNKPWLLAPPPGPASPGQAEQDTADANVGNIQPYMEKVPVPAASPVIAQGDGGYDPARSKVIAEYGALQAQNRQDQETARVANQQGMRDNVQWANAWTRERDAQSEARVRGAQARGGVFANQREQQAAIARDRQAQGDLRAAQEDYQKVVGGTVTPARNYIDEYARTQSAQGVGTESDRRGGEIASIIKGQQITQAGAQLDVKAKARLDEIGQQLVNERDPAKVKTLHAQLLALLGKDKAEEYAFHTVTRQEVDPQTGTVSRHDRLFLANKRTGETLEIGPQPAAAPPGAEGDKRVDAKGNKQEFKKGKWVDL